MYKIEKNKPIPVGLNDAKFIPTMRKLEVGDSFLIPKVDFTKNISADIHVIAGRVGIKVKTRKETGGMRVWRVEKKKRKQ